MSPIKFHRSEKQNNKTTENKIVTYRVVDSDSLK